MIKKTLLLLLTITLGCSANSQVSSPQIFSTGGNHLQNASAQISFTFGEALTTTLNSSPNSILTQGFHQTNLTVSSIDEINNVFSFSYFPVPVSSNLVVSSSNYTKQAVVNIYDANAKLVASQVFENSKSQFDLSQMASGNYFVTIENNNQLLSKRTISIIK
jgi:hypothetical protein